MKNIHMHSLLQHSNSRGRPDKAQLTCSQLWRVQTEHSQTKSDNLNLEPRRTLDINVLPVFLERFYQHINTFLGILHFMVYLKSHVISI